MYTRAERIEGGLLLDYDKARDEIEKSVKDHWRMPDGHSEDYAKKLWRYWYK